MSKKYPIARAWTFTSFQDNFLLHDIDLEDVRYAVAGEETCPTTGRKHYQGYVIFTRPMRLPGAKKAIGDPSAHFEPARGTPKQNYKYCTKEGNFKEIGDISQQGQGKRSDLNIAAESIKNTGSVQDVINNIPETYVKYHSGLEKLAAHVQESKFAEELKEAVPELRDDQKEIIDLILTLPKGKIFWVVDRIGGFGKSTMADHLCAYHNALKFDSIIYRDCAYLYNKEKYVIFDVARSRDLDSDAYTTIENFCNMQITSTKYVVCRKLCPAIVVVFANVHPEPNRLSAHRMVIHEINQN